MNREGRLLAVVRFWWQENLLRSTSGLIEVITESVMLSRLMQIQER